ncbi:PpiC domain-containing protein [Sandaracinus amylolyticus]|nr:PpiC domain-containing protein [Sandaracinus amylolyticus]
MWFVAAGAVIFAIDRALARDEDPARAIVIDDAFVAGLRARFVERHGRPPDAREEDALVRDFVRDEALSREARAAGLDDGDAIVRRRLVQKIELMLAGSVHVPEPDDAALEAWMRAHEDELRTPARVTLEHVLFARDVRGARAEDDARAALLAGATERGDPFVRGRAIGPASESRIAAEMGPAFARAVITITPEQGWIGPIASTYGAHLVRVIARDEARMPALDEARARVIAAWTEERRAALVEAEIARIVASYGVVVE